jgi:hypothetical protein
MNGYDYREMFEHVDDDVLIVEWDIAVGAEHFAAMADLIQTTPDGVVAAPYRIYLVPRDPGPHWVMRRYAEDGGLRWVEESDAACHFFGFGLTYIPRDLWRAHAAANLRGRVSDTDFSRWHHENVAAEVPIPWDVRPVHLHYPTPALLREEGCDGSA